LAGALGFDALATAGFVAATGFGTSNNNETCFCLDAFFATFCFF